MRSNGSRSSSRTPDPRGPVVAALLVALVALAIGCSGDSGSNGPRYRDRAPGDLFVADTAFSMGSSPWSIGVADFNGDGALDLAIADVGDRTIRVLYAPGGGSVFDWDSTAGIWDTTFVGLYRPRALAVADVDADSYPDLVVTLMYDDTTLARDHVLVLRSVPAAARSGFSVALDTLVGYGLRDVFVGDIDPTDEGVEIVAAPSRRDPGSLEGKARVPVLSRIARARRPTSAAADTAIRLLAIAPADSAVDVSLTAKIIFELDTNVDTLEVRKKGRIVVLGRIGDLPADTIAMKAHARQTVTEEGFTTYRYLLTPARRFRPKEKVTVNLTGDILARVGTDTIRLEPPKTFTFTATGLRVESSEPANGDRGVRTDATVAMTFNWWVDPASVAQPFRPFRWFANGTELSADLIAAQVGPDGRTVVVDHPDLVPPYANVQLVALPGIIDTLGQDTFVGDTISWRAAGPLVAQTIPANGATGVVDPVAPTVALRFNGPMAVPGEPNRALMVVGSQSGRHTVGSIVPTSADAVWQSASVSGGFISGEWVTVTATGAYTSANGFALAKPHVWRFQVRPTGSATLRTADSTTTSFVGGSVAGGRFSSAGTGFILADTSGAIAVFGRDAAGWYEVAAKSGIRGRQAIRAGDLNADGLLDVAVAHPDSDVVSVFLNTGGATVSFADPVRYKVGLMPYGLFLGDLDGDGDIDVATANGGTADVSVLLNDGAGVFGEERYYKAGDRPTAIDGGDLDGDGDIDLVVTSAFGKRITLLRNRTSARLEP